MVMEDISSAVKATGAQFDHLPPFNAFRQLYMLPYVHIRIFQYINDFGVRKAEIHVSLIIQYRY